MAAESPLVGLVVEGQTDVMPAGKMLRARGANADPLRTIITDGKTAWDERLLRYNRAARHAPWLVLRDSDRDGGDCPVRLRQQLLPATEQSPMLCFRLTVRAMEAWLLADAEAFADHFAVPITRVPRDPEAEDRPKVSLVNACRSSRRRDIRAGVVPPRRSRHDVGPEYTSFISDFAEAVWRPDAAAERSPSLWRALAEVERLVATGVWS